MRAMLVAAVVAVLCACEAEPVDVVADVSEPLSWCFYVSIVDEGPVDCPVRAMGHSPTREDACARCVAVDADSCALAVADDGDVRWSALVCGE